MKAQEIQLSIVIPVFNASEFIGESIRLLLTYFQERRDLEIICVNDGSRDDSLSLLRSLQDPRLVVIDLPQNRGKFGALKAGVAVSKGNCVIFTDADAPFDLEAFGYIEDLINRRELHIVIGDRALQSSTYSVTQSIARQLGTFVFSAFVRMFVAGGLFDTQCGLKGFRGDVAKAIFPLVKTDGFSGDVELLYIALKYNLEVKRIPVRLRNSGASTVRILSHGIKMIENIAALKLRWMSGQYDSSELKQIAQQSYWEST